MSNNLLWCFALLVFSAVGCGGKKDNLPPDIDAEAIQQYEQLQKEEDAYADYVPPPS